jgi:hypothetical protein
MTLVTLLLPILVIILLVLYFWYRNPHLATQPPPLSARKRKGKRETASNTLPALRKVIGESMPGAIPGLSADINYMPSSDDGAPARSSKRRKMKTRQAAASVPDHHGDPSSHAIGVSDPQSTSGDGDRLHVDAHARQLGSSIDEHQVVALGRSLDANPKKPAHSTPDASWTKVEHSKKTPGSNYIRDPRAELEEGDALQPYSGGDNKHSSENVPPNVEVASETGGHPQDLVLNDAAGSATSSTRLSPTETQEALDEEGFAIVTSKKRQPVFDVLMSAAKDLR